MLDRPQVASAKVQFGRNGGAISCSACVQDFWQGLEAKVIALFDLALGQFLLSWADEAFANAPRKPVTAIK
jgi:hypothetical protein